MDGTANTTVFNKHWVSFGGDLKLFVTKLKSCISYKRLQPRQATLDIVIAVPLTK